MFSVSDSADMTVPRGQGGRSLMSVLRGSRVEIGIAVLAVVAVITLIAIKRWQDSGGFSGPLEGNTGVSYTAPIRPGDTGVAWGSVELFNHSGSVIVLDRVVVDDGQEVTLVREPYIWGSDRLEVAHQHSVGAMPLPLPKEWSSVSVHAVAGYEIPSMAADGRAEVGPEIVIELTPPARALTISGITVYYHIGWRPFSKTFDNSVTICLTDGSGAGARVTT
jgi:hypothetical protein